MPPLRIDRCYCFGQTFAALQTVAAAHGCTTVAGLQAHADFGRRCRLCHPYIERMLDTGETVFDEIITAPEGYAGGRGKV